VLAYHNIIPDDAPPAGDRSLHVPRARFARQLDLLVRSCDVIPLSAASTDPPRGARPRVAITFDDAYQGALTLGAVELRARGLPATMFAAPGLLGSDAFWWDALAGPEGLPVAVRDRALGELRGAGDAVRQWAVQAGATLHPVPRWARPGTESELESWAATGSLTVGAHTWSHPNLSRLNPDEVESELVKPLAWLGDRFRSASVVRWIAYPYGLATPTVTATARRVGYEAGVAIAGGWIGRPRGDQYWLPRLNIPSGLTPNGFRLRLAGFLGRAVATTLQPPAGG
jgi:peptidoglycan/xylan/chitin deacetylase (PgdA/CDA1 family)